MVDVGLSHIALPCTDLDATMAFYKSYAGLECVHSRNDHGVRVAWLSDKTRPFVVVFLETDRVDRPLGPFAHLGVGVASRAELDERAVAARTAGVSVEGPNDMGPPVGYWAFLKDPDGHTLELSHGQEVGLTVRSAAKEGG